MPQKSKALNEGVYKESDQQETLLDLMQGTESEAERVAEKLQIVYDGPAVSDGTMDVDVLAPALLAIGGLLQSSNRSLYGKKQPLKIILRAEMERSSFHMFIEVGNQFLSFVSDQRVINVMSAIGFISSTSGVTAVSLIQLIKHLRGRKHTAKITGGKTEVIVDGVETLIINNNVYQLYQNPEVLSHLNAIVKPLREEGITHFLAQHNDEKPIIITEKEASSFVFDEEIGNPNINTITLDIITLSFERNYAWRFHDGENTISARIEDDAFWHQIDKHEVQISKGDKAVVEMQIRQFRTPTGKLKKENTVIKILEVIPPSQLALIDGYNGAVTTKPKRKAAKGSRKRR